MNHQDQPVGAVMVIGGGIAGIQASLDMADSGFRVYLVEEKPAIGGVMAQLDKTFPTNDCAMCVISPKLVEAGRHLNIELLSYARVRSVSGSAGDFNVEVLQQPRYVDMEKCTSCGECEQVCPVERPDDFNQGLGSRKAIYKLYPQGMPAAYAIEKRSIAPCKATCPAHVSIQGYVALINQGKFREAVALFRDSHPFPGVCGRVCHHPCESACTRNDHDQPLAIRELHRFLADWETQAGEKVLPQAAEKKGDEKVAVIGSGPAGLAAASFLARRGYGVTIFEKLPVAGGMMAVGIPEYRLPGDILQREIDIICDQGVEIKTEVTFGKDITFESLKADGYSAVFMAIGLHKGRSLGIENEDAEGVLQGVDFLRETALGNDVPVGKDVLVIGGGNVAIDVALTAKRKGAENVTMVCLEKREEMPAWEYEIKEALESDIKIVNSYGPKSFFINKENKFSGIEFKTCTAVFDQKGRFSPQYDENACEAFFGDTVIVAIGQAADTSDFQDQNVPMNPVGLEGDPITLQSPMEWVFSGGDAFYGPKSVVDAVACGREAAESIHRYINGLDLHEGRKKEWTYEKPDIINVAHKERTPVKCLDPEARECNFLEVSFGYNEDEARTEAERCLKCGICSECYQCVKACLAGAVDHSMEAQTRVINVGGIILAPGFTAFDPSGLDTYAYAKHPNVVTSLEFERILSASGPFRGHLVRPMDHREPEKIAWIQCVGSRDINKCDHSYCSSVCCMYAGKQAVIAKEHSPNDLDTAIFFMDMRTFGKEFERYYQRAKTESGVRFIRSRVHTVVPVENGRLSLRHATDSGDLIEETFDMVVLSVGLEADKSLAALAGRLGIELNNHGFAQTSALAPVCTSKDGIFVCGAFQEPKDIPASVMEASAAACLATERLSARRHTQTMSVNLPAETDVSQAPPRVGVFVCNCGINIGGIADVPAVRDYAATLENVVHVEDNLFTCSQDTQDKMKNVIIEKGINRVVVASCSPRTHEALFQETIREAGLNPYLFEMANIRDQNTWVHMSEPERATKKAKALVRMAVAKAVCTEPLHQVDMAVTPAALVVGGGIAGMEAALGIARQGFSAHLAEKTGRLGGVGLKLNTTWLSEPVGSYVAELIREVTGHPLIRTYLNAEPVETSGVIGNFSTRLISKDSKGAPVSINISHGVTILATGGKEYKPVEYLYGQHSGIMTHLDLDAALRTGASKIDDAATAVFIQCVGSRNEERPYCSKVCCTHSIKSALALKERNPDMCIYVCYRDIRTYGFREGLYRRALNAGIVFIRYDADNPPAVRQTDEGCLHLTISDHVLQIPVELRPDLLVLAAAVIPNENRELFELLKVPVNSDGFLVEAHAKLRPVDFASEGIFMAGLGHCPKPVEETIAQAKAVVSRAATILSRKNIAVGGVVADLQEPSRCACCLVCVRSCPYGVPYVQDGRAHINPAECHGCGVCAAECPAGVITLQHFTDRQILAKQSCLVA